MAARCGPRGGGGYEQIPARGNGTQWAPHALAPGLCVWHNEAERKEPAVTLQQTLTIPLTDLPPAVRTALAAGQRVDVVDGARTVALLVPVLPAAMSPAAAWAGLEHLLDEVDASGRGETFRTIMGQEQERA
jgi:hypothetical protein